jgi:radical SAM protein with 4Fe4S-binding SPASM domain
MCIRRKIGLHDGDLTFDGFKRIISKLPTLKRVLLQGQGEPFLNKELLKMINFAAKRNIAVSTCTNATLLNAKIAELLCFSGLSKLAISLDSHNKKTYEYIRGGADFNRVINNIKDLIKLRDKFNRNLLISFQVTLMKNNISNLHKYLIFAHRFGIQQVTFQRIQSMESFKRKYPMSLKDEMLMREELPNFGILRDKADKMGINVKIDEGLICDWPWHGVYVTWEGYITPCCVILDYEYYLGNIFVENFDDIWNGEKYAMFRHALLRGEKPVQCSGCRRIIHYK